ncbi:hypothetical protein [Streptomyces sp. NPDC007905]|uniref:hypothetical protein n=1 Tax=Streptomyces sp. NPDC007905 TaxID=3364788 RepID=UPI0036E67606
MIKNSSRSRRTATLLGATATLAVSLAASPASAAPTWESLTVPTTYASVSLLPFDSQNAFAKTTALCYDECTSGPKLWQRSGNTWKQLTTPTDAAVNTLAGTGHDDLWVIGRKDSSTGVFRINHYDGTKWSGNLNPDTKHLEILDAEAAGRSSVWGAGDTRIDNSPVWHPTVTHTTEPPRVR